MIFGFRTKKKVDHTIHNLDQFLDHLDECILVFKSGIKNYLEGSKKEFDDNLQAITRLRDTTTTLRRAIENDLYAHTLMVDNRAEVLQLVERLDKMVDMLYKNLWQYEIEIPFFPADLTVDFLKMVEISGLAMEGAANAAKDYFRMPRFVAEKTHRIYYFEKEVNKLAQSIKRRVFHEMDNCKLSQKTHLRYFTLHVEQLAEEAVKVADLLSVMLVKQNIY